MNERPPPDVAILDRFWSDGWAVIPDVLSREEIDAARSALVDAGYPADPSLR